MPILVENERSLLRVQLNAGFGTYADHNPWFGSAPTYTSASPIATDPPGPGWATWAEAWVEDLGWVGFDPANGICPTEHYVRVAVGLDALGATPIRGTSYGGGQESLTVALHVRPVQQTQQQLQSRGWSA